MADETPSVDVTVSDSEVTITPAGEYEVADGEVVESAGSSLSDDDVQEITEGVEQTVDKAVETLMAEIEGGVDVSDQSVKEIVEQIDSQPPQEEPEQVETFEEGAETTDTGGMSTDELVGQMDKQEGKYADEPFDADELQTALNQYDRSSWQDFNGDCMKDIADGGKCGAMWQELKSMDKAPVESSDVQEEETEEEPDSGDTDVDVGIPPGNDLLMVQSGGESSELIVGTLQEAIDANDVIAIPITSDEGQALIDPLEDVQTPFYLEATEDGLVKHPLEKLVEKYA